MPVSDKLSATQVSYARQCIESAESIVILTHQNPDGDAMGSSLAMRFFLMSLGKTDITNIIPSAAPDFLMWMPDADKIVNYEESPADCERRVMKADLVICTDFTEPKRIAELGLTLVKRQRPVLIIDHHLPQSDACFGEEHIIYPDSASASELVFRLVYQMSLPCGEGAGGVAILPAVAHRFATCIYTGMMTDTGNFSYNSCSPEMYEIVAMLLTAGINKDEIYNRVFNAFSADRMRLVGYCLHKKMRILPEYHTAIIALSRKEMYLFNAKSGDMEGIVNMPLQIKDVYYSIFLREDKILPHQRALAGEAKTKMKISFRSQGDRPVNIMARECFHGGGHMNASGGEFFGTPAEAVKVLQDTLPKYFLTT